jgi:hypothetical protein
LPITLRGFGAAFDTLYAPELRQHGRALAPNMKAKAPGSAGKSDCGPGHQLNDSTAAFHFDSGGVAWIHADDHALSADPQV